MNQCAARLRAFLLAIALMLPLAACGREPAAATMHLIRTEGRVAVSDEAGENVPLLENLGLYSGYRVDTRLESSAWINLDDTKRIKMDQKSKIVLQKEEKDLEIEVQSGSLFFNVTQPLENGETMNIRTSTMTVEVWGACGWVEAPDSRHMNLYLLEGDVDCSARGQTVQVYAGDAAVMSADGDFSVTAFTARDIPDFVRAELERNDDLAQAILEASGLDVLAPPEPDPIELALEQYRIIVGQADTYFSYEDYYDEAAISYQYALVRMQPDDAVPTLLVEQNVEHDFFGYFGYVRVFQYDPGSGILYQPSDILSEGVAGAGGYRGSLSMMGDGNGIESLEMSSGTGETYITRVTLEGGSLIWTTVWTGRFDLIPDEISSVLIDWHDISDTGALESWAPDVSIPLSQPEPAQPSGPDALPTDGDRIVFTGTVSIVGVFSDGFEQYNGQRLIFSIDPSRTWWPSDVSAPFGESRTSNVHVLGTAP